MSDSQKAAREIYKEVVAALVDEGVLEQDFPGVSKPEPVITERIRQIIDKHLC